MKYTAFAALCLLAAGCAVQKDWAATGGSRADGVVELSYVRKTFEKPVLDESQAAEIATERCAAWGYTHATAFGGVTEECQVSDSYGSCSRWLVTKKYQCLD